MWTRIYGNGDRGDKRWETWFAALPLSYPTACAAGAGFEPATNDLM